MHMECYFLLSQNTLPVSLWICAVLFCDVYCVLVDHLLSFVLEIVCVCPSHISVKMCLLSDPGDLCSEGVSIGSTLPLPAACPFLFVLIEA